MAPNHTSEQQEHANQDHLAAMEAAEQPLSHESAKTMMAEGPDALHDYVATKMERSLGSSLPQMEIRVNNLSLSADITVSKNDTPASDLPTLTNTVKHAAMKFNAKKHKVRKDILKNVNAVFKPGTITLVLGQPGSGKSSLMKYLSGTFPMRKNVNVDADVYYNGMNREELLDRLPQFVSYVTQRDVHFPTLTVKETLEFAHEVCGGGLTEHSMNMLTHGSNQENLEALEAARAMFQHYPEIVIQQLGLDNCKDTIVGNAMMRGVSGGEKKRVTTGEMEFGMKYATFMDEISTGLDAAAAFDIVKTQRSIARKFRKTVVIGLLQPPPEVFDLFDNVMILNEGETIYNGPRESAESYFESLGFNRPQGRDVADFLMDLGTKEQYRYAVDQSNFKNQPRLPSEFAAAYKNSHIYQDMVQALDSPYDPELVQNTGAHMEPMSIFRLSFIRQLGALMRRQTKVTMRNTAFLKGRGMMVILIGLLYASAFYQVNPTDIQLTMGILFQAVLFLGLGQASQMPTFLDARAIFYKQRGANFYSSLAYAISCSVNQLPLALGESLIFGTLVYWMCGLVAEAGPFFIYIVMLILTNLSFAAYFFFISAISPDLHIAKPLAMISVLFFILFAGFVLPKGEMPGYTVWIYWMNPIAWCLRALAINQYQSSKYSVCVFEGDSDPVDYCKDFGMEMGEYYLKSFGVPTGHMWIVYGVIFTIAVYIFFMGLAAYVLEHKRYDGPEHVGVGSAEEVEEDAYTEVKTPKNASATDDDVAVVEVQPGQYERQFTPVTVAFRDLVYTVPMPEKPKESLDLLKGITGYALPGKMTALMGSSGAGKTTLMDVIAGRKTGGQIKGDILLNGYPATDLAIRRCTGYCEQMDIHSEASTIREALTFSAFLRQGSDVPDSKKFDSVNECLDLLDLNPIADQIIRGSSVEQMKRLTIGVELAAQPSVIFLDEPTSGLDARSAKVIMDGVRKVADSGRTIICTIHQPSYQVFSLFDSLLLLKRGGETVFFGDLGQDSRHLIDYFESKPNVQPLREGYNPATWMLEVIGAGVGHSSNDADYVKAFQESENKRQLDQTMEQEGVGKPSSTLGELSFGKKRAASSWVQCQFLVGRFMDMYWRTPSYNLTRIVVVLLMALVFGIVFVTANYDTFQGINGGIGMVFMSTLFCGIVSFNSVLPITGEERAAFYRERAAQTYNALWYFVGSTVAEIPYVIGTTLLFTVIFYPMVGFQGFTNGVLYWLATALYVLFMTYLGQFFVYALPSVEVAAIVGVLVNTILFTMMGFNPPADSIPQGYIWLYKITPQRFPLAILESLAFAHCKDNGDIGCQELVGAPTNIQKQYSTVKEYTEGKFKMIYDDIGFNFGMIIIWIVGVRLLALLSLRFINHQKR